ncbi:flavin-containing monooxygenase [Hyphococcus sp.]|uniref:flavin-containing monooxygenase n=1 Tax=Hyphococcus sp. TaxID=2038636 RepID=UPI003CCC2E24
MPDDMRVETLHEKPPQDHGPRIAILGAGFSGMGMAIRLRQEGFENFTIYEKAGEVGGTWRENRYPGVACDVPSHLYSFSFEPNPNWSRRFSPGDEIFAYMKHCAVKYDLYRSIAFNKTVKAIRHNGAHWNITFADGAIAEADFVVSGLGGLHEPNIPDFDGAEAFDGALFHTAQWRDDVDLKDKRVAIIGSAASAVQVIPEIVGKVKHLDLYQRTPNWVMPRQSYRYPDWVKSLFAKTPWLARAYRGFYFSFMEWRFASFKKDDNGVKRFVRRTFEKHLANQVKDPALRAKLTPDYPVGCKRILISDDYFAAIQRHNVDLVTDRIACFSQNGVLTADGKERAADVIILATGFKPFDILESIDVTGPSGQTLRDHWKDGVAAHRTIMAPGFPNFFLLLGPNSGLGHNSVILMIEAQVNYIVQLLQRARAAGAGAHIEPRPEAAAAFDRSIQADLQERVWASGCGAWYVDENGRNYTLYPHAVRRFLREMKTPDLKEYSVEAPVPAPPG